jgi:hypothetical protein
MQIQFPNQSRSYNSTRRRIEFWGHDRAREISFYLETDALEQISPTVAMNEAGALGVFDANRARIERAASKAYSRHAQSSCILTAADL